MSKGLKEPLLNERSSISPPSSPRISSDMMNAEEPLLTSNLYLELASTESKLSEAVRRGNSQEESSTHKKGALLQPSKKLISVNYWSQYNKGDHFINQFEIFNNQKVLDLINISIQFFSQRLAETNQHFDPNPAGYVLRFASKHGKPKSDMPCLDVGQSVLDTGFVRFALCFKKTDESSKEKLEYINNISEVEEIEPTSQKVEEPVKLVQKNKRSFWCCFSGD